MEELAEAESNYIRENIQNPLCKNGYIPGSGFYCKNVSIETREKISSSLLGNKNSLNNIPKNSWLHQAVWRTELCRLTLSQ
jgi:hypothetical protein